MERSIIHMDINHCYAQIEEMRHPALRDVPMVVGGAQEKRHGIVLAKNLKAKPFGITTGEALVSARSKCPGLLVIPPDFEAYQYYTEQIKDHYRCYSDRVESFGLDEAWIDLSGSLRYFNMNEEQLARRIQTEIRDNFGLTVSVGVSFNKVFAKLGSDQQKPYGFYTIHRSQMETKAWPLPVSDLLYVGHATAEKLHRAKIYTIGELAQSNPIQIDRMLGKIGAMLWSFANGLDHDPVARKQDVRPVKSIGNSITTVRDMVDLQDLRIVFQVLGESIASRLRDAGMAGNKLHLFLRGKDLQGRSRQTTLVRATDISTEIIDAAMSLVLQYESLPPLRSVGISISGLQPATGQWEQCSLFEPDADRSNQRRLDAVIDQIRTRYGYQAVRYLNTGLDRILTDFNPKKEHTIHPIGWLK